MMNDAVDTTTTTAAPEAPEVGAAGGTAPEAAQPTGAQTMTAELTGTAAAGTAADKPEQATPEGLPEKYTFNLPEGLSMTPEIESKFTELAHSIGLTQEQADGLVKLHSDIMMEQISLAEKQKNAWADQCTKEGLATPEKMKIAKLAVDTFDDTGSLMKELLESGLAYSPTVQRFLQTIGGYLVEDSAPDSKPAPQAKSAADLLFGNSTYN